MRQRNSNWVITGVLTAVSASLCCITPVLALVSGTSGMASTFSWMEPLRPYLIGVTFLVLGFAWYQKLRPKKVTTDDCGCEVEKSSFWQSKKFLGIVTAFSILMLAFPYYSAMFYPTNNVSETNSNSMIKTVEFQVEGMTCAGCEEHVNHEVGKLAGIARLQTSYEKGNSTVTFNPELVSVDDIQDAINSTGYSVIEKLNKMEIHAE